MRTHEFILPKGETYMCGHSLGPMPMAAQVRVSQALQDWQRCGVGAWNKAEWMSLPYSVADKIAPLIGALESEVVLSDSTSVNLFKVLMSALKLQQARKVILTTEDNFPADLYIAQGIAAFAEGVTLKTVRPEELLEHIDEHIAVVMLTHVNYRDASMYDMKVICEHAHKYGVFTVWDLSHSVGIVPLALNECRADFAVGCTYKYLNGGPGSPSFVYVHERHERRITSPICGWIGHDSPFAFMREYHATGSACYIGGTPYVLSIKGLEGALHVFDHLPLEDLYARTLNYSSYLINALADLGLRVLTPKTGNKGGHVAFLHEHGYAFSRALIDLEVTGDYRTPDLIRLCINPLYLTLDDINKCIKQVAYVLEQELYLLPKYQQQLKVT